jgi:hypothetical protein
MPFNDPLWLSGLIWALFMGWAASSYASNFSYRIPRGETPFGREPYCGDCDHKLYPKDLFPIFSWLFTGGKCHYCGSPIPASYCLLELGYTLYVGLCYLAHGFSDFFILYSFTGMVLQIIFMMAWDDEYSSPVMILLLGMSGLFHRLMQGGLLQDGLLAAFFGLFGALVLHRVLSAKPLGKDVYAFPHWIWLSSAAAIWITEFTELYLFLPLALVMAMLYRSKRSDGAAMIMSISGVLAILLVRQLLGNDLPL